MAGLQNFQDSKIYFERALHLLKNNNISDLSASDHETARLDILLGLGVAHTGLYEMETAAEWYQKVLEPGQKLNAHAKLSHAFAGLARTDMVPGTSQDDTIARVNQALHHATEAADNHAIAISHNLQGYIYAHYNDLDGALEAFLAAITALEALDDDYETALMLNNVGKLEQLAGDYDHARPHLEQGRNLALQVGHFNTAILSTSNLGVLEFFCENYQQAIDYFQTSIDLMIDTGDRSGLSHLWIFKSFAQAEADDEDAVYKSLLQAIECREDANRDFSDSHIIMGAARWYLMQNTPHKSAILLGLAEHLGGANPFMREWLDPLQEKLSAYAPLNLPELFAHGEALNLTRTVEHIFHDFAEI